jgi:adenylate cyclase
MSQSRQLAAIMFTDIVGYTTLMQENEQLAMQQREQTKKNLDAALTKYGGKLLQHYGDGTLSVFSSALNAVKSATEIQTVNRQDKIEMRIGIHTGDVMFDDTGIYGDSVNVASRIESLAVPGAVFISEKLFTEIGNQGIEAKPLGYFELKNVKQPMQVYAVSNPGLVTPSRDEVKGKVKQTLNSIAVLPFSSLSSDPENDFFCDGITEELLNVLAKIEGLQVTSRTSSFVFKGKTEDIREIAAKLNVQKILEGSVRKAGNKVRITAQLINAADGYHVWSETYDRSLEDIFAVQDDIAREIANKFRLNLDEKEHLKELVKAPTENMDAYKKYLEGIYRWNTQLPEQMEPAIKAFSMAAEADQKFAAPYSYLAFIYFFMFYAGIMPQAEALKLCRDAAMSAMKRNPNDPEALLASGISQIADFDWNAGKISLERSVSLNPNNSLAQLMLASYYFLVMQYEKTEDCFIKARQVDPIGAFTNGMVAEFYVGLSRWDEAIAICDETLKVNPDNPYIILMRVMAIGYSGDWKSVITFLEEARSMYGDYPNGIGMLGLAYIKNGQPEKAEEMIQVMLNQETQQPGLLIDQIGLLYGNLLRKDEFFDRLNKSIAHRSSGILWNYKTPHLPDEISNDERFQKVRREVGLPV